MRVLGASVPTNVIIDLAVDAAVATAATLLPKVLDQVGGAHTSLGFIVVASAAAAYKYRRNHHLQKKVFEYCLAAEAGLLSYVWCGKQVQLASSVIVGATTGLAWRYINR